MWKIIINIVIDTLLMERVMVHSLRWFFLFFCNKPQCCSVPGPDFWFSSKSEKMEVGMGTPGCTGVPIGGLFSFFG